MCSEKKDQFDEVVIPGPEALKDMDMGGLEGVCASLRRLIAAAVEVNGGHLASNMGVVELTVALHRVFEFPPDRLVFDVGHQCYAHKMLTGRKDGFRFLRNPGGVSGYPDPGEHEADTFVVGHAGTAISTAMGLAEALSGLGKPGRVVSLVGDASIQNGMSLEALNHLGEKGSDVLIVLNDNEMGISPTVGAVSASISRLRADSRYLRLKSEAARLMEKVPLIGKPVEQLTGTLMEALKRAVSPGAVFEALGIRYYGPVDGHDLSRLVPFLEEMKSLEGPRVLHVLTKKGFGHGPAEEEPTAFHSAPAVRKGEPAPPPEPPSPPALSAPAVETASLRLGRGEFDGFNRAFGTIVKGLMEEDERVVAVTAAMLNGTGLDIAAEAFGDRVFDVGIAEGHAVGFCAGMAKGGLKPVCAIYSTFLQRAVDQVFHEVALQDGLGVVFALDRAGMVGGDGPTHQGLYDVPLFSALPGVVTAAPRDAVMLEAMLRQALRFPGPYVIRYPKDRPPEPVEGVGVLELGRGEVLREGERVVFLAFGAAVEWSLAAAEELEKDGVDAAVADLRFASPLDEEMIVSLAGRSELVVTVEDGILRGGVGDAVAACLLRAGLAGGKRLLALGVKDGRIPAASRRALREALGLSGTGLAEAVRKALS